MKKQESLKVLLKKAGLSPCRSAREWLKDKTLYQAWTQCHRGDWMCWLADQINLNYNDVFIQEELMFNENERLLGEKRAELESAKFLRKNVSYQDVKDALDEMVQMD